ncbi:MAG: DNA alkylation repair protein [bacterium]
MKKIIRDIVEELKTEVDEKYKDAQQWFFKEGVDLYGVRVGMVRRIGRKFFKEIRPRNKKTVFGLGGELLKLERQETRIIAFQWALAMRRNFELRDLSLFEKWLKKYVTNWASCDGLCTGPLGELLTRYPQLIKKTVPWRKNRNRWVRRGAAVSLIKPVKRKQNLADVFKAADILLLDEDDMVQKGYGWMLKEASNIYGKEVFDFVMKRKDRMPRTALRYAIEKMPPSWRKKAMS